MSEHNDGGSEKKSFEYLTWCLRWLMLMWLARINLIQRCTLRSDAWTKNWFSWDCVLLDAASIVKESWLPWDSSYLIDEFSRTKIFVVEENVRPSFSTLMFKGCL